ncbi:hypothetical protein KAU19_06160 [Candidatus Parcubacteria bacterium]|nr:hypothetical protein [Candidatus Parcubacteria bacterium]
MHNLNSKINFKERRNNYFLEETRQALVSNKNVILYYYYLKNLYPNNGKNNFCHRLFKDRIEEKFFLNKDEWCALEDYVDIVEKAIKITNNFELPKIVGSLLTQYQKEYKLQEFKEAALQNLGAFFFGPVNIFKQISSLNHFFNDTKDMHFVQGRNGKCIIKIKFKENVNPVFDFVSEMHIEGIFNSILDLFGVNEGKISTVLKEYDLKLLIEEKFKNIKQKCREEKNLFLLDDEIIAEKVTLIEEKINKDYFYLGKIRPYSKNDDNWAWRIKKNIYMDNKYIVLKEGELYNAPYFITVISWNKLSYLESASKILNSKMSHISPLNHGYAKLIQERLIKEQKAVKQRAERQKMENEFYQLLLKNYIHPSFIKRAKIGLIPFKDIAVTNVFLDIHQSTQLRKKIGDEAFRQGKNILLKLIKKGLQDTAGEWGWLNKMMGDGCYIVFGAYNYFKDTQDDIHVETAINFSLKLINEINRIKNEQTNKQILADFYIRFGVETGQIEIGEAYEQDIEDIEQEIDLGTLRIFDTDGHSINIAKRIEELAKEILIKEGREGKNGIFLGPDAADFISNKNNSNYNIRKIDLKEYGMAIRDYGHIDSVSEIIAKSNDHDLACKDLKPIVILQNIQKLYE